jgi:plasmid stabilization system protein ParE
MAGPACCRSARALQVLLPTAAPVTAEVSGLAAALTAAAGGSSDGSLDLDEVLLQLLGAWGTQRAADEAQLARVAAQSLAEASGSGSAGAGDHGGRGLVGVDEFAGLVRQVRS